MTKPKPFASSADTVEKRATLHELADGVYAYTAEGDPNVGAIVGTEFVVAVDARSTPAHARTWLDELRGLTSLPVRYLVLTHYHAVRALGAAAFEAEIVVSHEDTRRWIVERGKDDFESELRRFPRLFRDVESVPGLTMPDLTFSSALSIFLGDREVQLRWLGRGHTAGDAVVWLPQERVLFAGDLVEAGAAPYMGDAYVLDWAGGTLGAVEGLGAQTIVPGRGPAVRGKATEEAIASTRAFLIRLRDEVAAVLDRGGDVKEAFAAAHAALEPDYAGATIFEHCMPFNVRRMADELRGEAPRVWTAERDAQVWAELQA
ncbi:MAG: MBL fold metallo-hydrolase [Actinobacteria bacterium]|nr:MBL fold metallo-hydrolase [Actinomycetota bacterium]